jgi:DNA invertase Pin-like site-specific DNA recombinase
VSDKPGPKQVIGVSYHRVSTLDQDPTLAREELRRAAAARDIFLIDEIEETGSGARNDRPGLQRVMQFVRAHLVSAVLVWKLDRFGRSSVDVVTNVKAIKNAGATFVATSQAIEIGPRSGAMGDLILTIMSAMAEFERAIISERTLLGLEKAKKKGRILGRPKGSRDQHPRKKGVRRSVESRRAPPPPLVLSGSLGQAHAALMALGYRPKEIARVLPALDPSASPAELIRVGLAALRRETS